MSHKFNDNIFYWTFSLYYCFFSKWMSIWDSSCLMYLLCERKMNKHQSKAEDGWFAKRVWPRKRVSKATGQDGVNILEFGEKIYWYCERSKDYRGTNLSFKSGGWVRPQGWRAKCAGVSHSIKLKLRKEKYCFFYFLNKINKVLS